MDLNKVIQVNQKKKTKIVPHVFETEFKQMIKYKLLRTLNCK